MNIISKSANLAPYLKATNTIVSASLKPLASAVILPSETHVDKPANVLASYKSGPIGSISAISGVGVTTQIRCAHTDLPPPDFEKYLKNKDPTRKNDASVGDYHYLITGAAAGTLAYGAKSTLTAFLESMSASAGALSAGKIEIKLGAIPEGKSVTFKWRGKPVFIRHRTESEIKKEEAQAVSELRDPQTDQERVKQPEWLVVIGVCTHLGCVPIANAGDWGGYYCPCHGSHYDASGRVRKGPAPLNLEVPPYEIEGELLTIG